MATAIPYLRWTSAAKDSSFPRTTGLTPAAQMAIMYYMRKDNRQAASFTLDPTVLDYVRSTRGRRSRSERVNELLHRAMELERRQALEAEAAAFFASVPRSERIESRAFQRLARRSLARD